MKFGTRHLFSYLWYVVPVLKENSSLTFVYLFVSTALRSGLTQNIKSEVVLTLKALHKNQATRQGITNHFLLQRNISNLTTNPNPVRLTGNSL